MGRKVAAIDVHKKVLMVVAAATVAEGTGKDQTEQRVEHESRRSEAARMSGNI